MTVAQDERSGLRPFGELMADFSSVVVSKGEPNERL
jgi:hypothetical protein